MYESIEELSDTMRDTVPEEAQKLYVEGYNRAWQEYDEEETEMTREAVANRAGWAEVKREFVHDDQTGKWHLKDEAPEEEEVESILDRLDDSL